jgi:outer membrane protein assembly factor BamB
MAAREEFDRLKEAYLEFCETPEVFTTKPFHSTEGRAILAMGKRALPFIVEEIRNGKTSWKWAAFFIIPPLPPPDRATWEETAEAHNAQLAELYSRDWVKWWGENRNNPEWNVFLEKHQDGYSMDELIRDLGNDNIEIRIRAQTELVRRGEMLVEELERALNKADSEVAGRIRDTIEQIRWHEHIVWGRDHAVDIRTGRSVWNIPGNSTFELIQSRAIGQGVVISFFDGRLERRSLRDGTPLWKLGPLPEASRKNEGKLWPIDLWVSGSVLLRVSQSEVRANTFATGSEMWSTKLDLGGMESPRRDVILGRKTFIICTNQKMHAYDLKSGKEIWRLDAYASDGVLLPDGDVILATGEGILRCSGQDGRVQWKVASESHYQGRRTILAGRWVLIGSGKYDNNGVWTAILDSRTGKELWRSRGVLPTAAVWSADRGALFITVHSDKIGEAGRLYAIECDSGKTRWTKELEIQRNADAGILKLDGERLLVCEYEQGLVAAALTCFKAQDGARLWKADVSGVGFSDNSHLSQEADLEIRKGLAVLKGSFGTASYLEVFNLDDGNTVSKWRCR